MASKAVQTRSRNAANHEAARCCRSAIGVVSSNSCVAAISASKLILLNIAACDNAGRAWEADMKQYPVAVLGGLDSSAHTSSSIWPNAAMSWWSASVMPLRTNFLKLKGDVGQV